MRPAILNQCDISVGVFEACLDLSFHLCIHLLSASCYRRHPIFPAAAEFHQSFCYSLWRPYLNGSGLTLTVHSCLHIYQSILSSIFYLSVHQEAPLPLCYHYRVLFFSKTSHKMLFFVLLFQPAFCYLFVTPGVPSSFTLHFTHLLFSVNTAICLVIHPSSNTTRAVHFPLSFYSKHAFFFFFLPSITNQPFHGNISLPFSYLPTLSTLLFFFISHPLPCHITLLPLRPFSSRIWPIWLEWLQQM